LKKPTECFSFAACSDLTFGECGSIKFLSADNW
jgi:hypothetical protein